MRRNKDDIELLQLMERKQILLLKLKAALVLDLIDLVKELSCDFQTIVEKEHLLTIKTKKNVRRKKISRCYVK